MDDGFTWKIVLRLHRQESHHHQQVLPVKLKALFLQEYNHISLMCFNSNLLRGSNTSVLTVGSFVSHFLSSIFIKSLLLKQVSTSVKWVMTKTYMTWLWHVKIIKSRLSKWACSPFIRMYLKCINSFFAIIIFPEMPSLFTITRASLKNVTAGNLKSLLFIFKEFLQYFCLFTA